MLQFSVESISRFIPILTNLSSNLEWWKLNSDGSYRTILINTNKNKQY